MDATGLLLRFVELLFYLVGWEISLFFKVMALEELPRRSIRGDVGGIPRPTPVRLVRQTSIERARLFLPSCRSFTDILDGWEGLEETGGAFSPDERVHPQPTSADVSYSADPPSFARLSRVSL